MEAQSDILEQKGYSDLVTLAYQQIAPLLVERKAIQSWIRDQNRTGLLAALPEVASVDEAATLMVKEHRLDLEQIREVTELLNRATGQNDENGRRNPPTPQLKTVEI